MSEIVLIGRVLFAGIFLYSAFGHLTQTAVMAQYAKSRGVPLPITATIAGGLILLTGGLSVLLGVWADLGAVLLATFLIPTAIYMHSFWTETGDSRTLEATQFLKDMALAGAALMMAALISHAGPDLGLTLTGPLFAFPR